MKKNKYALRIVLLIALIAVVAAVATACKSNEPEKIAVEGSRTDFFVGDVFETGADFKVYAVYPNGDRQDVTAQATVRQEKNTNMNAAGSYLVTVEYEGMKEVYTIYVHEQDVALKKLEIDSSAAKTTFKLGDAISLDGIRITATYASSAGRDIEIVYGDLQKFTAAVTDPDGNEVKVAFEEFGTHTVTVSAGGISASYSVNVEGVNLDTVQNAIYVAKYGRRFINQGRLEIYEKIAGDATTYFTYKFGDNYTFIAETPKDNPDVHYNERHYSIDPLTGKLVAVTLEGGQTVPSTVYVPEAMDGVQFELWWHGATEFGMEAAIANLYNTAQAHPNGDYQETVDLENRTYRFSFGYLMHRTTGVSGDPYKAQIVLNTDTEITINDGKDTFKMTREGNGTGLIGTWKGQNDKNQTCTLVIREDETLDYNDGEADYTQIHYSEVGDVTVFEYGVDTDDYYFVNEVEFTMNDEYSIVSASFTQNHYTSGFVVDADGHAKLDGTSDSASVISAKMTQTVGERTGDNPYSNNTIYMQDFDLFYEGSKLDEGDVIMGSAGETITLYIRNILPETADLTYDLLYFSDGKGKADPSIFTCNGFAVYRSNNVINLRLSGGGEWELVITTKNLTKRVRLSVIGRAPEKLTSEVYQSAFHAFSEAASVMPMVNVPVYLRAVPNEYANGAYTAALTRNDAGAQLELTEIDGQPCWKLVASKTGVCEVTMTSEQDPNISCTLTVTVVDIPDFDAMFDGTYTAKDGAGGVYHVTFRRDGSSAAISGTMTVVYTPADGEQQTQELKFAITESDLTPTLDSQSDVNLGISLTINVDGELVLVDRMENQLILTR